MKEQINQELESGNQQAIDSLRAKLYKEYENANTRPGEKASSEELVEWESKRMKYVEKKRQQKQYGASDRPISKGHVYKKYE